MSEFGNDLLSMLGKWWRDVDPSGSVIVENLDNPGWRVQVSGVELTKPFGQGGVSVRRSMHDWIDVVADADGLVAMGGPLNLNELLFHVLVIVAGESFLRTPVPEVPSYWHTEPVDSRLDMTTRLTKWFLCQCNYDWEHGHGVTLATVDGGNWRFSADTWRDEALDSRDLHVLGINIPEDVPILFWKEHSIFNGQAPSELLSTMLSRALEWLEQDWVD